MTTGIRAAFHAERARWHDERRFLRWAMTPEGRLNATRLKRLGGHFRGRRAVVMGNGPSLLRADLDSFADDVTIVSNAHYLIWDQLSYVPTILTAEDRLVVEDRAAELRDLGDIVTLFPFEFRPNLGPAGPRRIYINFLKNYRGFPRFSHAFHRRAFWGGTVTFLNLQLANYLGCNPIILVGFDHSYRLPPDRGPGHVIESDSADVNHIHPDYFGAGYRWHDPLLARMESAYSCARLALEGVGVQVLNATDGGHLEAFERIEPLVRTR